MIDINILVVDDEDRMRKLVKDFLIKEKYNVLEASDGIEALDIYNKNKNLINLIILDVMMPNLDGWSVCEEIRKDSKIPIIMLTAKAEEYDELKGFDLGVDEYITKPFSPKILVARVNNLIKRFDIQVEEIEEVGIKMNLDSHTVFIDGEEISLSMKEFQLLEYFLINKDRALSRDDILRDVWNYDYFGDARTVDTHVKKLRQKIGSKGDYIKTIWGMGYKFESTL